MTLTALDRGFGDPRKSDFRAKNIVRIQSAGISLNVHKELADIFKLFCALCPAKGFPLEKIADDWGYNFRPIRGYEDEYRSTGSLRYLSNHSWGSAIDLNATQNPMTSDGVVHGNVPKEVIGVAFGLGISWGGYYSGKRKDPMHWEWLGTVQEAREKTAQLRAFFGGK